MIGKSDNFMVNTLIINYIYNIKSDYDNLWQNSNEHIMHFKPKWTFSKKLFHEHYQSLKRFVIIVYFSWQ